MPSSQAALRSAARLSGKFRFPRHLELISPFSPAKSPHSPAKSLPPSPPSRRGRGGSGERPVTSRETSPEASPSGTHQNALRRRLIALHRSHIMLGRSPHRQPAPSASGHAIYGRQRAGNGDRRATLARWFVWKLVPRGILAAAPRPGATCCEPCRDLPCPRILILQNAAHACASRLNALEKCNMIRIKT